MIPADRTRITSALRDHVAKIAADLRAKMRAPGPARERARQLHADEKVGEDFEVWTDLLSRRAAVLWVLKSVYIRVLEDRGLLNPGRLLDPEAQQLFEKLAPHLGETAFLRWICRDLASPRGGLPELFSTQPAEIALPSDELSRALISFWRFRNADTGKQWSFADEHFEGELMGDLYQELDPVVKDRFALCQTPDFVRSFILDRTLTPAIETFGADEVRLLDPACGSGHFLIDGLKRIVAATAAKHTDWARIKVVTHALNRVVGIDLNDYACALARTRLIMTAAELAGVSTLAEAAQFHPHVYWADGLEQVERDVTEPPKQFDLFEKTDEKPRAALSRADVREALKKVFAQKFHAVVANPPYILERDEARKAYHREQLGKNRRYVSASGKYSLASPFTERCFQLAEKEGYVGIITSNNFMKREFGKVLIEKVISGLDLTLVVDTSHAYIPYHGTPTVLLFGRNRPPSGRHIRAVMGKRGESGTPQSPANGRVWLSIIAGWEETGFENEFVSVAELPRDTFAKHPWSLGGGGASELKEALEAGALDRLGSVAASIGYTTICGEDPVFLGNASEHLRQKVQTISLPLVAGDSLRDWSFSPGDHVLFPYESLTGRVLPQTSVEVERAFWRYRALLRSRVIFQQTLEQKGMAWYEHMYRDVPKLRTPLSIAFAFVATHNHFVLDRGGKVFKQSAPVIKLPPGSTEDDHLALLGLLNSSTLGFWMRQVFHVKGGESTGTRIQSEPWSRRLEYDATKLAKAPIVGKHRDRIIKLSKRLDALASSYLSLSAESILNGSWTSESLERTLRSADAQRQALGQEMIAYQEELDWTTYVAYGLASEEELVSVEDIEPIESAHRPFAIALARRAAKGGATNYWFEAMEVTPTIEVPNRYSKKTRARLARRLALIESDATIGMLESPEYKRKWEPSNWKTEVTEGALDWLSDRVEDTLKKKAKVLTIAHVVSALQDDDSFLAVATIYQERKDLDITGLVTEIIAEESVPSHRFHIYTESGLSKRQAWEETWALQRREDNGEKIGTIPVPPEYSQGSRGKATDFLKTEYWQLRGKLDVPKERFIAFTEVPRSSGTDTLYGWAGWTPIQRLKALLAIDEELEDSGVPLADRVGVLDSAWRLLPDVAREDQAAAIRLKAELQSLVGPEGPSKEVVEDWRKRFPPPTGRGTKAKKVVKKAASDDEGDE